MSPNSLRQRLADLRYGRLNSALARRVLSLFYREGTVYTVPFGCLKGVKLQYDSSINFHAMLGLWETESLELLQRMFTAGVLPSKAPVLCDIGANIGLYTIFMARSFAGATVYAFEPAPVVARLRTHLRLNQIPDVVVVEQACSDTIGTAEFHLGHHHHASSLHADWARGTKSQSASIRVATTTLDDFFFGSSPKQPPDFFKIDIEGGGTFALRGCGRCVTEKRPLFLIESHTPAEDRAVSDLILKHNYAAYRLDNHAWVEAPDRTHPDPHGVWGTLLLWPGEKRSLAAKVVQA